MHWLIKNEKNNKSTAFDKEKQGAKKAVMHYKIIATSENYFLLEVDLETGRHHQIRTQLSKIGCPIKGISNTEQADLIRMEVYAYMQGQFPLSTQFQRLK